MADITYEMRLDLINQYVPAEDITVVQESYQSVEFAFEVAHQGNLVNLSQGSDFVVSFIKPDKTIVLQGDAVLINGKITLTVNPQAFTSVGKVYVQAHYKIGTKGFNARRGFIWVERGATSNQTISSTDFVPVFDKAIEVGQAFDGISPSEVIQIGSKAQQDIDLVVTPQLNTLDKKTVSFVTPEMYGAIGNGITDDTASLESMINGVGNQIKLGRNKVYKITRKLRITKSFTEVDLNGSTIQLDSSSVISQFYDNKIFYVAPSTIDVNAKRANVTSVSVYYKFGNSPEKIAGKFIVDDTSKFKVGDCVVIEYLTGATNTHTLSDLKPSIGTYAKILEIDTANKIIYTDYYTELDFRGLPPVAGSGYMYAIDPVKKVKIKNGTLQSITPNASNKKDCAIRCEYVDGLTLDGITLLDFNDKAIQPRWIRNATVRNIESDVQRGDKTLDYVIQCLELYSGTFENIVGASNTVIVDFSFGCSYIQARNIQSRNTIGSWGSIQLHGECEHDITFENCSGYFSFANNTGEFVGYSYNITLQNCKGATYLMGCDNLQINDSNLIVSSSDFSELRIYGVSINDSNIQLIKSVSYKASSRGGVLSPYLRFSNCNVKPFYDGSSALYKYMLIGFNEVSFSNNCRVYNTKAEVGSYFVLDAVSNFEFKNSKVSGFLFSVRNNEGSTAAPFTFGRYLFSDNEVRITDANCGVKLYTTSLDWLLTFSNVSDLFGSIIFKNNRLSFNKNVSARKWNLINFANITTSSNIKFHFYRNEVDVDTDFDLDINLPHNTGYRIYYDQNIIDPININEYGVYRLSNYYTGTPTSGTWDIRKRILNKNPVVGQPKSWICTATGSPGTWVSEGIL